MELLDEEGVDRDLSLLRQLGLTTLDRPASYYGLSLTVGSAPASLLDLTYAYATLANGGLQVGVPAPASATSSTGLAPAMFLRVTDARGNLLESYEPGSAAGRSTRVVSPQGGVARHRRPGGRRGAGGALRGAYPGHGHH